MKTFILAVFVGLGLSLAAQQPFSLGVPSGTMFHFDLASCPGGWTEFTAARGFYITGLVNAGTKATAVGSALMNQETRTHTHTMAHTHTVAGTFIGTIVGGQPAETAGGGVNVSDDHTHTYSGTTSASSAANTGADAGVIAPYMQYILCSKN